MRKSVLDRRTFVMGSAGVGASALVGGMLAGCAPGPDGGARLSAQEPVPRIRLSFDGAAVEAALDEGEAARAFAALLPLELAMDDLNGNEKFAALDAPLPTSPYAPGRVEAGDLMLYGDDCAVLFYESFDTPYRYTRLGRVEDAAALAALAAAPSVDVTFVTI